MSRRALVAWGCATMVPLAAFAQGAPGHDMSSMPGMDMTEKKPVVKTKPLVRKPVSKIDHAAMHHDSPATPESTQDQAAPAMATSHEDMAGPMLHDGAPEGAATPAPTHAHATTHGDPVPPDARDPDAYADGLPRDHLHGMDMDDDARHLRVLVDRLETFRTRGGHGQALDAQAWYGGDLDKLWLKVDGGRSDGRLGATRTEALWDHVFAAYWSLQGGVRHDFGAGPGRTWAALGVQGLSPYRFDVQATAYVGEGGRTALRFETGYDLRITQRFVLQPDVKVDVFGRDDDRRGIGAGVSDVEAGLRGRYEITRQVAPYVGVVWTRTFGNTARFARHADESVRRLEAVAGIRFWF